MDAHMQVAIISHTTLECLYYRNMVYNAMTQSIDKNLNLIFILEHWAETGSKFWPRVLDSMTTFPSGIYYPRNTQAIVHG